MRLATGENATKLPQNSAVLEENSEEVACFAADAAKATTTCE